MNMNKPINGKRTIVLAIIVLLFISLIAVPFVDAHTSKKSSTEDIRSELSQSTKDQVEQSGACRNYCEIDHKVPLKCDGGNDASNLQSLPENVHKQKTSREAKLCTEDHPGLTCGGLKQEVIEGFNTYLCFNAEPPENNSAGSVTSSKKSVSSGGSGGCPAGKCYVSGYTTKKGKRVSAYCRRC
jgi:hypothetical protein